MLESYFGNKGTIEIKKELDIPLITKYDDKLYIEGRITNIINIKHPNKQEYEYKPIIKEK